MVACCRRHRTALYRMCWTATGRVRRTLRALGFSRARHEKVGVWQPAFARRPRSSVLVIQIRRRPEGSKARVSALVIPLGVAVSAALRVLTDGGLIEEHRCLFGSRTRRRAAAMWIGNEPMRPIDMNCRWPWTAGLPRTDLDGRSRSTGNPPSRPAAANMNRSTTSSGATSARPLPTYDRNRLEHLKDWSGRARPRLRNARDA